MINPRSFGQVRERVFMPTKQQFMLFKTKEVENIETRFMKVNVISSCLMILKSSRQHPKYHQGMSQTILFFFVVDRHYSYHHSYC